MGFFLISSCVIGLFFILVSKKWFWIEIQKRFSFQRSNPKPDKADEDVRNEFLNAQAKEKQDVALVNDLNILHREQEVDKLKNFKNGVPFWRTKEIYSVRDINQCTNEQLDFYTFFKSSFLKQEYCELEGNTNYAFILLFDFLREFSIKEDIICLEQNLTLLSIHYPETLPYAENFLRLKRELIESKSQPQDRVVEDVEDDEIGSFPTELDISILDVTERAFVPQETGGDISLFSPMIPVSDNIESNSNKNGGEISVENPVKNHDRSIEDVTNQSYLLQPEELGFKLVIYDEGVPIWNHMYIYSFSDLNVASKAQIDFYNLFKASFLKEVYFDLESNTNYAFILLFDLLDDVEFNKDLVLLEKHLHSLAVCYPKTRSYARSFLLEKMRSMSGVDGLPTNQIQPNLSFHSLYNTDYEAWLLGNKYKTKLNLTNVQVTLLNSFYTSSNNFTRIEYCKMEIIKLFLETTNELEKSLQEEQTTLADQIKTLSDIIARKHFKYRTNSYNYNYCIESTYKDLLGQIYKHCENAVREYYGHKRKLSIEVYYVHKEILLALENLITKVKNIITPLILNVNIPDEVTEVELFSQNSNRWKIRFSEITDSFRETHGNNFIEDIKQLAYLNRRNPSVENIFYEASKFISPVDKQASLVLYIHYLHQDLKSSTFDNKKLTKAIQKSLFKTESQLNDFEIIVRELIRDRNIERALSSISKLYEPKRKSIKLDSDLIDIVSKKHSGTVELLNQYLNEDNLEEQSVVISEDLKKEEIHFVITPNGEISRPPTSINSVSLNFHQTEILNLFKKGSLILSQSEIDIFVKERDLFKNQFIESINDACYEAIDDILIEEEDENYIINDNYYNKIFEND